MSPESAATAPRCDCPALPVPHTHEPHGPVVIVGALPIMPAPPASPSPSASMQAGDVPCRFVDKQEYSWEEGQGPKPGDMFWIGFSSGHCSTHEPPCERHLHVVLPNGHWWDIDSRASNCTMKDDKQHRCWVRHGEPPLITVDKEGLTCAAGAGSIQSDNYHGFLRNGVLVR